LPLQEVPEPAQVSTKVAELIGRYLAWIESTSAYRKNGLPTSAHARVKKALEKLRGQFGSSSVRSLTRQSLVVFRDHLCSEGHKTLVGVNKSIQIVKRMIAWAAERGFVQDQQAILVATVKPLKEATRKKPPVPLADLRKTIATLQKTAPVVADMVRMQFLMGCRPGEIRAMRWRDIDRNWITEGKVQVWRYLVADGKTLKEFYPILPEAQEVLLRHQKKDPSEAIFTPHDQRLATGADVTRVAAGPAPYGRSEYLQCVQRAAKRAKVSIFGVHQVRHTSLSLVANDRRGGLGTASALANHASQATTARFYATSEVKGAVQGAKLLQGHLAKVESVSEANADV